MVSDADHDTIVSISNDDDDLTVLYPPGTQGNAETGGGAATQEEEEDTDDENDNEDRHPGPEELVRKASNDVRSAGAGHCHIDHVCHISKSHNEDDITEMLLILT